MNHHIAPRVPAGELRMYRSLTFNLLRKYFRLSLSLGRLPSLVGRECFRTRYELQNHTFEDSVIFVHDMEKCLARLDYVSQQVLARIVFEDHDQEQTARLLRCTLRTIERRLPLAIDRMAELMLEDGLIRPFPCHQPGASPAGADENSPARECRGEETSLDTAPQGAAEAPPQVQPKRCQEGKIDEFSAS